MRHIPYIVLGAFAGFAVGYVTGMHVADLDYAEYLSPGEVMETCTCPN